MKRIVNILLVLVLVLPGFAEDSLELDKGITGSSTQQVLLLDLKTALELASQDNLSIKYELLNNNIADAQHIEKISRFLPSIKLTHSIIDRNGNAQFFGDNTVPIRLNSKNFAVNVNFDLFQGGRVLFGYLASKENILAQEKELSKIQQDNLQEVANNYLAMQRYQSELNSELARLQTAELNLKEREIAVEVGKDIKLSILLAKQEVIESQARITKLKGDFYKSSSKLNNLLNIDSNKLIMPEAQSASNSVINTKLEDLILNNLIYQATNSNPSVQKELASLAKNKYLQKQSFAPFFPRVSISLEDSALGSEYNHLVNNKQGVLSINYELFEHLGGTTLANIKESRHRTQQQYINLQRQINNIKQEVTNSYIELISQSDQLKANKLALEVSQESQRFASERLKAGVGTQYELKISQSNLEDSRANYYDSLLNYQQAEISLIKNIGLLTVENIITGVNL